MTREIPIEVSARHLHLSQKDLEALFGRGYKLKKLKQLTQPGDFAAKETINVEFGNRELKNLRIVGPVRTDTQVELAMTDAINLGVAAPVRISGNIAKTPGLVLVGPKRKLKIKQGAIVPQRHIHCSPEEAKEFCLKKGALVSVKTKGARALTFHNVRVRIDKNYRLCMHIDTDEGNAAGINKIGIGTIL